jgi:hypothetical protein
VVYIGVMTRRIRDRFFLNFTARIHFKLVKSKSAALGQNAAILNSSVLLLGDRGPRVVLDFFSFVRLSISWRSGGRLNKKKNLL